MIITPLITLLFIISVLWSMRDIVANFRFWLFLVIVLYAVGWAGLLLGNFILFMFPLVLIIFSAISWLLYATYANIQLWWQQRNNSVTEGGIGLLIEDSDDWEATAITFLRQQDELTAIELVQQNTGLDFEQSRVKLYKLDDADMSKQH